MGLLTDGTVVRRRTTAELPIVPRARRLHWLLAWLALLPVAVLRAGMLAETDTFWQVRTGLLTIAERAIPRVDPFSWTAYGESWRLNSWGFNIVVGIAYRLAGLPGVAVTCAALVMAIGGMVLLLARRLGASPAIAATFLLLASPLLIAWLSARPQLIDYIAVLVLVLLLSLIVEGKAQGCSVVGVGLLSTLWVNLHAGALLGIAIVGVSALLLMARRTTRTSGYLFMAATASAVAGSLINPYGAGLFTQTAQVKSASMAVVAEWQHLDPSSPTQMAMLAIGVAGLSMAVRRRDAVFSSALIVATIGSLAAMRMLPILVLLALPVLAEVASHPVVLRYVHTRRVVLVPGAVVGLAALVAIAAPSLGHIGRPDPGLYPIAVVQDIPPNCRLFNSYILGGFVLLQRPDVSVSLDSRNDLYGEDRVLVAERMLRGEGDLDVGLAGAGCVLVPPSSGLAHRLRGNPHWQLHSSEPGGALFLRHQPQQTRVAPAD